MTEPSVTKRCNRWKYRNRLYGRLASQYALDELCRAKQWHQTKQRHQSRGCSQSLSGIEPGENRVVEAELLELSKKVETCLAPFHN